MKFRKKPVVIEAIQWMGTLADLKPWMDKYGSLPIVLSPIPALTIQTLEGNMLCQPADWIIRGIKGEFYPCKPDIFEATYEAVESPKMTGDFKDTEEH